MAQSWAAIKKLAAACEPKHVLVVGATDTALELALTDAMPGVQVFFTEHLEHELAPTQIDAKQLLRPANDRQLRRAEYEVEDLHYVLPFLKERRVAVQAGGAYGLWPLRLSEVFKTVYTFEPAPENFDMLVGNTAGRTNIIRSQLALGKLPGMVDVVLDQADNAGAAYTVRSADGIVPTLRLDDLGLENVDLVWLDVEGAELDVIEGAWQTLKRWRPVVLLECKPLAHRTDDPFRPVAKLEQAGYSRIHDLHRDVLMVPKERMRAEKPLRESEPERFDLVVVGIHGSEDEVSAAISRGYARLNPEGWIAGTHFTHRSLGVQRAVAAHFNLMHVACAEGAVWMFQKQTL